MNAYLKLSSQLCCVSMLLTMQPHAANAQSGEDLDAVVTSAHSKDPLNSGPNGCDLQSDCNPAPNSDPVWVEAQLNALSDRADDVAIWVDSFFGTPQDDTEASFSRLRLRADFGYDEEDGFDTSGSLRGKIYLPSLDERLSIVFSSDEDEEDAELLLGSNDNNSTGLQYDFMDTLRESLSVNATFNSSLDFRSAIRYRRTVSLSESWSTRFTERVYYRQEEGFGLLSRVDVDYRTGTNALIRWTSDADYGEETNGVEWRSILGYWQRLSDKNAVNYFVRTQGETDPDDYIKSYGFGVKYRTNWLKPWLFVELEPAYAWQKNDAMDSRRSNWSVNVRFEFVEQAGDERGIVQ